MNEKTLSPDIRLRRLYLSTCKGVARVWVVVLLISLGTLCSIWARRNGGTLNPGIKQCMRAKAGCAQGCINKYGNLVDWLKPCLNDCDDKFVACVTAIPNSVGAGGPGQTPPPKATPPPGPTVPPGPTTPPISGPISSPPPGATVPPSGTNPIKTHPIIGPVRGFPTPSPTKPPVILLGKTTPTPTPKRKPTPTPKPIARPAQQTIHHSKGH